MSTPLTRRSLFRVGTLSALGLAGAAVLQTPATVVSQEQTAAHLHNEHAMFMPGTVGEVNHAANGFNPTDILTDFDYGKVSTLPSGQTLHEYSFVAGTKDIEVAPGIM